MIRGLITDLWDGLFVYRYPPCCVLEYVVRLWLLRQAPYLEWLRRTGAPYAEDETSVTMLGYNTVWDAVDWVPCAHHTRKNPGEWVYYPLRLLDHDAVSLTAS